MDKELYHHGIKGQKWGVRRYQNYDGSLTQEGYQRYGLNPDGSRFRKDNNSSSPSKNTYDKSSTGVVAGLGVGTGVGYLAGGPVGAFIGAYGGMVVGGLTGYTVGLIDTHNKRKKIKQLLSEKGKVYVNDI